MIYLQNKVTGEIKDVEPDTQEYRELIAERDSGNRSVWEQQSDAAVAAKIERAESGTLRETDLPKAHKVEPERNKLDGFGAEKRPWENLTDAEVALGLTPERKKEEEENTKDMSRNLGNKASRAAAADAIAGSDTQRRGGAGVASDIPSAVSSLDGSGHGESSKPQETEGEKEARQDREREEAEVASKRRG